MSCSTSLTKLGNGWCDKGLANREECNWDGGDCCESTCLANPDANVARNCGINGYDCQDPNIIIALAGVVNKNYEETKNIPDVLNIYR